MFKLLVLQCYFAPICFRKNRLIELLSGTGDAGSCVIGVERDKRQERITFSGFVQFLYTSYAGYLDYVQIEVGISAFQTPADYKYAKELLSFCNANRDGRVDYQEFRRYMDDKELELYRICQAIDVEHNGCILPEELYDALMLIDRCLVYKPVVDAAFRLSKRVMVCLVEKELEFETRFGLEHVLGKWLFKSKCNDSCYEDYMFPLLVKEQLDLWPKKYIRQRVWVSVPKGKGVCQQSWMKEALDLLSERVMCWLGWRYKFATCHL